MITTTHIPLPSQLDQQRLKKAMYCYCYIHILCKNY